MLLASPIIHPTANVCYDVEVGLGSVVAPHVSIGNNVRIGSCVIIREGVIIESNVQIADYAVVGPRAILFDGSIITEAQCVPAATLVDGYAHWSALVRNLNRNCT